MILDIFALFVIALLLGITIWLIILLGNTPGDIARKRNHPQADAITALSWIGLITMGAAWVIALVWAYYKPSEQADNLQQQIDSLKHELQQLQANGTKS